MDINVAKQAGALAVDIERRQALLPIIDRMLAEDFRVTIVRGKNLTTGEELDTLIEIWDAALSQTALGFVRQTYVDKITALQAELAAL